MDCGGSIRHCCTIHLELGATSQGLEAAGDDWSALKFSTQGSDSRSQQVAVRASRESELPRATVAQADDARPQEASPVFWPARSSTRRAGVVLPEGRGTGPPSLELASSRQPQGLRACQVTGGCKARSIKAVSAGAWPPLWLNISNV